MADIAYFYDGDRFVAALDKGYGGFFTRHGRNPEAGEWRFIIPGSITWDSIHQDLYYAHHDLDTCPPEIAATLPPLPSVPP
jgi:hypothetical protein